MHLAVHRALNRGGVLRVGARAGITVVQLLELHLPETLLFRAEGRVQDSVRLGGEGSEGARCQAHCRL